MKKLVENFVELPTAYELINAHFEADSCKTPYYLLASPESMFSFNKSGRLVQNSSSK